MEEKDSLWDSHVWGWWGETSLELLRWRNEGSGFFCLGKTKDWGVRMKGWKASKVGRKAFLCRQNGSPEGFQQCLFLWGRLFWVLRNNTGRHWSVRVVEEIKAEQSIGECWVSHLPEKPRTRVERITWIWKNREGSFWCWVWEVGRMLVSWFQQRSEMW